MTSTRLHSYLQLFMSDEPYLLVGGSLNRGKNCETNVLIDKQTDSQPKSGGKTNRHLDIQRLRETRCNPVDKMCGTYAALLATPPNAPLIGWGWPIKTSSSSSMSSVRNSSSIYNDKMNKPSCKQLPSCRRKRRYIWISNPYDFHKERGHIKKKKRTFCI